jgi:glutamyl-tRNA synthetase
LLLGLNRRAASAAERPDSLAGLVAHGHHDRGGLALTAGKHAHNRDLIDEDTDRRFLVRDGEEFPIEGGPDAAHPPIHPNHEDRGERDIPVGEAVLLEPDDVPAEGERVWLKGFGPVRRDGDALEYTDDDIDVVRSGDVDVIHWVPAEGSQPLRLRTMNGDVSGHAEPGITDYDADAVVQFERIGFARIDGVPEQGTERSSGEDGEPRDKHEDDETVAYYAHS